MYHCCKHERKQVFEVIMAGTINRFKNIIHFVKDRTQVDLVKKIIKNISEEVYIFFNNSLARQFMQVSVK